VPARDNFVPYREYIGSNLEVMDLATKERKVLYRVTDSLQAPIGPATARLLSTIGMACSTAYDLATNTPALLDTGEVKNNNNDHVISFDGKMLASAARAEQTATFRWSNTVPLKGGAPKRAPPKALHICTAGLRRKISDLHGGREQTSTTFYRIPVNGGDETSF
jgi:hypothetical protein